MAIPSTHYDFHTYAIPWINSVPEAPVLIEIRKTNEIKLQVRTPQGNVETNYPAFTASDFQLSFTIPLHNLASVDLCDCYLFQQLSRVEFGPNLCNLMKQGILNSTFDPSWSRFRNLRGIQVTVVFKVTTTIELVYTPTARYDQMVSLLSEEVVIMDDDGGSVQRRRGGATKAAIDGLKKVVFFNGGGGGGEEDEKCAVCLEKFGEGTEVTCMPCSHLFHDRCIVPWLEASNTCPMCRSELPSQ